MQAHLDRWAQKIKYLNNINMNEQNKVLFSLKLTLIWENILFFKENKYILH